MGGKTERSNFHKDIKKEFVGRKQAGRFLAVNEKSRKTRDNTQLKHGSQTRRRKQSPQKNTPKTFTEVLQSVHVNLGLLQAEFKRIKCKSSAQCETDEAVKSTYVQMHALRQLKLQVEKEKRITLQVKKKQEEIILARINGNPSRRPKSAQRAVKNQRVVLRSFERPRSMQVSTRRGQEDEPGTYETEKRRQPTQESSPEKMKRKSINLDNKEASFLANLPLSIRDPRSPPKSYTPLLKRD